MQNLRQAAGFTQQSFAAALGVDRSTVAKWEAGKAAPRVEMLPSIASLLHSSIEEIVLTLNNAKVAS